VHAGRQVQQGPGVQFPVGDEVADVRVGGAGGDRPVHVPHVVLAGLVGAGVAGFAAGARVQAEVFAVQQAVQPPGHGEGEAAQGLLLAGVGGHGRAGADSGASSQMTRGGGTAARTWSTTEAAVTPSASASKVRTSRWVTMSWASAWTSSGST